MTRNEKIREILENAKINDRKVTLLGDNFHLNCKVWYVYRGMDKVNICVDDVISTCIPFDLITSVI